MAHITHHFTSLTSKHLPRQFFDTYVEGILMFNNLQNL